MARYRAGLPQVDAETEADMVIGIRMTHPDVEQIAVACVRPG